MKYILKRMDDNGHEFVIKEYDSFEEAETVRDEFEAKAHKQTYYVEEKDESKK